MKIHKKYCDRLILLVICLITSTILNAQIITTIAGGGANTLGDGGAPTDAAIGYPTDVKIDVSGNIYIAGGTYNKIRKIDVSTGLLSTIAGNGTQGYNGDNILAINAQLYNPYHMLFDTSGNLYISDVSNNRIRKVNQQTGIITTVVGNGIPTFSGDNTLATSASIHGPQGIRFDNSGNLYFSDLANLRIRKVSPSGIITTIAGTGGSGYAGDNGPATSALFNGVYGLDIDASGNLFLADWSSYAVRKIDVSTGIITTYAGNGIAGYTGDNVIATTTSMKPFYVSFDSNGNLYISDFGNNRIRKVDHSTNIITTIVGNGALGFSGDGNLAINASLHNPEGLCFDACGNLYIADEANQRIRKVWLNTTTIPSVTINVSPNDSICTGASVTFTATPVNAGASPTYQWLKNGTVVSGVNVNSYTYIPNDGDSVKCILVSSIPCAGSIASNAIYLTTTSPTTPTISIAASPTGAVCAGTSVIYTATITNGGTAPSYQWIKNGSNVGTNSATYTYTPNNGDSVRCVLTSNVACATPVSSNMVNMTVNPSVVPNVNITVNPSNTVCTGTSVTFTATPTNGGTTPSYQWQKNTVNVGTNSATYTYIPANGDQVKCVLSSNATCASPTTATSNIITMTVSNSIVPTVTITVSPNDTVCAGTTVTYTATQSGGGSTPAYQWIKNGTNTGTNNSNYTYTPNNNDSIRCILTSNAPCAVPAIVSSNTINMTVNPIVTPTITVASSPTGTICTGGTASYTANITNGGTTPSFQWIKNGSNVGTNSSIYSYTPNNGDSVRCMLTSSIACTTPVSSNTIYMTVNPTVIPTINITASPIGVVCAGTNVTYTAAITSGGTSPIYQWKANGTNTGANSNTFTYIPNNGDSIRCVLTSNATCASPAMVSSNTINMAVNPTVVPTLTITVSPNDTLCADSLATFTVTATNTGSNPSYQWLKNGANTGNNATTYTYQPANGDSVRCVLTSNAPCAVPTQVSSNNINMVIYPNVIASLTILGDTNVLTGVPTSYTAVTNVTGATYQWQVDGVNMGTNSSTFIYTPTTTDAVISCYITVPPNSCAFPSFATTKVTVHIVTGVTTTHMQSVQIYPNPTNNELHIDNMKSNMSYRLQNIVGMTVQQGTFTQEKNMLQLQDIPAGIYLLQLTNTQGQREVVRVVKE